MAEGKFRLTTSEWPLLERKKGEMEYNVPSGEEETFFPFQKKKVKRRKKNYWSGGGGD